MMHHGDQLAIPYGDTERDDLDQLTVWDYDDEATLDELTADVTEAGGL